MKIYNFVSVFTIVSFLLLRKHLAEEEEEPEEKKEEEEDDEKPEATKSKMQMMQEAIQSKEMQEVVAKLKDDPELKEVFDSMLDGEGGPQPDMLMKYLNDPEFLKKIGQKVGEGPAKAMQAVMPEGGGTGSDPQPPPGGWKCGENIKCSNLLDAASIGDVKATEKFLAEGMDPNEAPEAGRTALHFAAAKGEDAVTTALIKGKADVGLADEQGNTPLHMAAGYGYVSITNLLLDAGATPDVRNAAGMSPAKVSTLNNDNPVPNDAALRARLKHDEL